MRDGIDPLERRRGAAWSELGELSAADEELLSERALGRALLARQGLLERLRLPLPAAVEAIGAMQGQAWAALPVGLWTRLEGFVPEDLFAALERRELLWGIGIRGTLHLVSAREHAAYAALAEHGWTGAWQRTSEQGAPAMRELRAALLEFAAGEPRSNEEIREFVESWVGGHPDAIEAGELEAQRALKWRPIYRWSALVRAPKDGVWGSKAPADHIAAPWSVCAHTRTRTRAHTLPQDAIREHDPTDALAAVVRAHLRAFGPAAAEDVACWIGWRTPLVRALLEEAGEELVRFVDAAGRTLYDLPGAPRPDPQTPAAPRLLGAFDSTLLAYAVKRRQRIVPDALRDVVYQKANLQIRPTFLLDGLVAGTWSLQAGRGAVTLKLSPAGKLTRAARAALSAEAEDLLQALRPELATRRVVFG